MQDLSARSKAAELFNPSLKRYDDVLRKHFPTPLRLDSQLRAVLVMDTITVLDAHGISLAEEFRDPKLLRTFEEAIVAEWYATSLSSSSIADKDNAGLGRTTRRCFANLPWDDCCAA